MSLDPTAKAMQRMRAAFERRPAAALQDDSTAVSRWEGGTRVTTAHANGVTVATDLPAALGGSDGLPPPGWLMRAGLASCAATSVLMAAAAQGVAPSLLEVTARSRSDARGLLGMAGDDGEPVYAGPGDVQLAVRIAAPGLAPARLQALVEEALRWSPVPQALTNATPMALHVDVVDDGDGPAERGQG